ncbi:MAG: hypothetical protein NVSMB63_03150 [Sediminibacterium sp.]
MKKNLMVVLLAVVAGLVTAEIKAQPPWAPAWGKRRKQEEAFYYYPSANVYYSPANRQYIYPRNGVWVSVATPHFGFSFSNMPHQVIYNDRPEVWLQNREHVLRYHGVWHGDGYYEPNYDERNYGYRRYKHHHHDDDDDDDDD